MTSSCWSQLTLQVTVSLELGYPAQLARPAPTSRPRIRDITARISLSQTRFPINSYIRIPCDVNSGMRPSITWLKNGYPLDRSSRVRVLFNNTLAIDRAQPADGGNYICRGSNGYSEAQDSVNIVVEDLQVNHHDHRVISYSYYDHQVQDDCVDNPYFANCKLIVKARYCANKYYAKFCCRSCTLAGKDT